MRDVVVERKKEGVDACAGLYNEAANLGDNVMIGMMRKRKRKRRRRRRRRRGGGVVTTATFNAATYLTYGYIVIG
jgi:hypothetical protein